MIKKSVTDLAFVSSKTPLPTVEVNVDSLEASGRGLHSTVMGVLSRLAREDHSLRTTVYLYGSVSVNFHEPCWSEFLIVAGPKRALTAMSDGFRLPGVRSRNSDYLMPSSGKRTFHVEDGLVWEQEDGATWYTHGLAEDDGADVDDGDLEPFEEEGGPSLIASDDEALEDDDADEDIVATGRKAARFRAARSDAKVSSIRSTIEEVFGLPSGSVALCGPDGSPLRGNALIKTLRKRWDE